MIGRSDILDASILIVDDLESNISLLDQILAGCPLGGSGLRVQMQKYRSEGAKSPGNSVDWVGGPRRNVFCHGFFVGHRCSLEDALAKQFSGNRQEAEKHQSSESNGQYTYNQETHYGESFGTGTTRPSN
jgi:hypothetical protein